MSLKQQFENDLASWARYIGQLSILENAMKELGLLEIEAYVHYTTNRYDYQTGNTLAPQVVIEPSMLMGLTAAFQLVNTAPTLRDVSLALLPKVGRWEKSFNEESNKLELRATFRGVKIVLRDTPPDTCTVEKIEEEVEVPEQFIAAHTTKKVRFVLKGDCDPLMKAPEITEEVPA